MCMDKERADRERAIVSSTFEKLKKSSKEEILAFLVDAGIMTSKGKLTKFYAPEKVAKKTSTSN